MKSSDQFLLDFKHAIDSVDASTGNGMFDAIRLIDRITPEQVNLKSRFGTDKTQTLISYAMSTRNLSNTSRGAAIALILLERGADVETHGECRPPLLIAILHCPDVVSRIIDKLNKNNFDICNPLVYVSVSSNHKAVDWAQRLINRGADYRVTIKGKSLADIALQFNPLLVEYFTSLGVECTNHKKLPKPDISKPILRIPEMRPEKINQNTICQMNTCNTGDGIGYIQLKLGATVVHITPQEQRAILEDQSAIKLPELDKQDTKNVQNTR